MGNNDPVNVAFLVKEYSPSFTTKNNIDIDLLKCFKLEADEEFYDRADEHINLSNNQITESIGKGKVSASFMYSAARFNAWVSASGWNNKEEMKVSKEETVEYFVTEYRKMLEENLDDYIENFNKYMGIPEENA